ncbi:ABC family ABC transporter, putative [Actinidia rufa]|uniref:ABC family ABC transporter, putative n=1 Tax=Actinidia rufa TaxID=165716 RepID=A0A7J0GZK3_9ERIC|nr:ABC family ABC transporter, putative [Actinidia rufa]
MGDYRSTSYTDGRMQIQSYHGHRLPSSNPHDLRKGKAQLGLLGASLTLSSRERKRVASYRAYSVEGKVKRSFRKSFKWIKDRYNQVVYGWG